MSWHLGPLAAFDIESTGIDTGRDRIVTAALVAPSGRARTWLTDVDGLPIPDAATAVHGITTDHARAHGRPAAQVVNEITGALHTALTDGTALVVMNAPFDLTLLDAECRRHRLPTLDTRLGRPVSPVVDPLVLDRAADKWRKGSRRLESLAAHYGVTYDNAHTADADATAALYVALRIAEKFPELQVPADVLHAWQATWHARWAADYENYLRRTNPGAVVPRGWPLTTTTAQETTP